MAELARPGASSTRRAPDLRGSAVSHRRSLWAWAIVCGVAGLGVLLYLSASLAVSRAPLLMPLDDTYIHFQYARQMAAGEPFTYSPGAPATSGGTSLLYPATLALGYLLGFTGWGLAYWALALGALAFAVSAGLVYRIGLANPFAGDAAPRPGVALIVAVAFALTGPFLWAALSGMETALFLLLALLALDAVRSARLPAAIATLTLLPLLRPEGLFLSALGSLALALRDAWPRARIGRARRLFLLSLPILAGAIQPLLNLVATGSLASSGNTAKSLLTNTSVPLVERLRSVVETFGRMWLELLTGVSRDWGLFTSPALAGVALGGLLYGVWIMRRRERVVSALALVWLLALTGAASTLDTAFWQFKRYQVPVMALLYPAAAWACAALADRFAERGWPAWARWILPLAILLPAALTTVTFARNYAENAQVVRDQQVPMARWAAEFLPRDARVGVHDVGLMGYFSGLALYDVVGLTTPGPAESWRQGPGAIFEHMAQSEYRPEYFAIYPDVQGLTYLVNAGVFGDTLAEFAINLPPHNVAAAAGRQIISRADWSDVSDAEEAAQADTLRAVEGLTLVDVVDVADLEDEAAHNYVWEQGPSEPEGFVTEVYRLDYQSCGLGAPCAATDGGRVLTGREAFTLRTRPGEDLLLVTRTHGRESVSLAVKVNGERRTSRVQPAVPGRWVEFVTWVPGEQVSAETRVQIVIDPPSSGAYQPYYHWAYQGVFSPEDSDQEPIARFGAQQQVRLLAAEVEPQASAGVIEVRLTWLGPAPDAGDAVLFVHLYNDREAPPVAQADDARPGGGALPPGNWLPGVRRDAVTLWLPPGLAPGEYALAIGLYDATTGFRLPVSGEGADASERLFIGDVLIEESDS